MWIGRTVGVSGVPPVVTTGGGLKHPDGAPGRQGRLVPPVVTTGGGLKRGDGVGRQVGAAVPPVVTTGGGLKLLTVVICVETL